MEVEVREEAVPSPSQALAPSSTVQHRHSPTLDGAVVAESGTQLGVNNTPPYPVQDAPVLIVRAEEVLLVVLVLVIWVAAIALFFNRWGKIRMLEPYQPKFQQSHRPSCPLAPLSPPGITPQVSATLPRTQKPNFQRMSFSKYNVNCFTDSIYGGIPSPNPTKRPRMNSVFVGSSAMAVLNPPRRVKSAMDIQHLIVNEKQSIHGFNSMLPISLNRDRRPSINIERPPISSRRRPSIAIERPYLSQYQQFRTRRTSCFVGRSTERHKNFTSFDHPVSMERKKSISVERPSCSYHQPTISFEASTPSSSVEQPTVIIEKPPAQILEETKPGFIVAKTSRSFETPRSSEKPPTRMSVSLDVNPLASFEMKMLIPEEEVEPPVVITLEETQITAPLLERLKSSDV